MDNKNKQRLEQLVRQGIVPSRKLPILMTAMSSLHMGKQLTPTERDVLSKYMFNMTDIMLKDDTAFNRAKLHTQKTRYQTEETTVDLDEKMVDGVEIVDGPEEQGKKTKAMKKEKEKDMKEAMDPEEEERLRKGAENKARRLSVKSRSKFRMLPKEIRKEKEKAGLDEEVIDLNTMYKEQFEAGLEYYGIDNIRDLPEESKAEFFKLVDAALEEAKMAKKDHDGDGKVETSTAEYMGSRDKAIKKATKPSWDSKQARANALDSLDKKAQARQDMKKESFEDNEKRREKARADMADGKYNKDGSRKVVKLKGFGPDAAKGNMSNSAARAALMKKEEVEVEEETERLDEYGNPAATPDRLAMIRRAADRVQSGQAAKDAEKRAKADMKQKGAQKGMAPTKKDVKEQVAAIRKVIKEGSTKEKIEAYKELNTIIEQYKTTGEL